MRIVIFGGTTEGRELSRFLAARGAAVTVCVATDYGRETQGAAAGVTVLTGRKGQAEMASALAGAALCVDATHPYAVEATKNIRAACLAADVPYRRLVREACANPAENRVTERSTAGDSTAGSHSAGTGMITVADASAAAAFLASTTGNILLATGAKELSRYARLDPVRLFPRILPTHEGLSACEALNIPHRNIIAMQGPFSRELNEALIRQYSIAYLVTKDGGRTGGFPEKAQAARNTGTVLVLLRRPAETGAGFAEIAAECENLLEPERVRLTERQGMHLMEQERTGNVITRRVLFCG